MFTGIIETIGKVESIEKNGASATLSIRASLVSDDVKIGDSIAVSGICLTVTKYSDGVFVADVSHETLSRTNLAMLKKGDPVNIERAMRVDGRFGGHIVAGHVDAIGRVGSITRKGPTNDIFFEVEKELLRYVVEKGQVAIDGVSLTVNICNDRGFSVVVIPHTLEKTTLAGRGVGDRVNLEVDIIGKYVEKQGRGGANGRATRLTEDFLKENGF